MTTQKQIDANKQNALLSTGPKTAEGKGIVKQNAVQHGIFTKELIVSAGDGKEDEHEFQELLEGMIISLNPIGQLESLLTEKITADFWRLRRVMRYETGSIRKILDTAIYDYNNKTDFSGKTEHRSNDEIEELTENLKNSIAWNKRYIKALTKGIVKFDNPTWVGNDLESDIEEDLLIIINEIQEDVFRNDENDQLTDKKPGFTELRAILMKAGYSDSVIAKKLTEYYINENTTLQENINELEDEKKRNGLAEEVLLKTYSLPDDNTFEKVIKYEKAIQRSIFQNLALLKRLQSMR